MKGLMHFFRTHKKGTIISFGAFLIVVGVAMYAVWSLLTWSNYTAQYETWKKTVRTSIEKVLTSKTTQSRLTALKESQELMATQNKICEANPLITWQIRVAPSLRAKKASCEHIAAQVSILNSKAQALASYTKDTQKLVLVLSSSALKKSEVTENDFGAQKSAWQAAATAVGSLSVDSSFVSIKSNAQAKLNAVMEAWQSLQDAHVAKDKAKFSEATTKLTAAYTAISEVNVVNEEQYASVVKGFQAAYEPIAK